MVYSCKIDLKLTGGRKVIFGWGKEKWHVGRQPSASWLPTYCFQAEKGNMYFTETVFILCIKDSRKSTKQALSKHIRSFCSLLPILPLAEPHVRTQAMFAHSHSSALPLYSCISVAPGLILLPPLLTPATLLLLQPLECHAQTNGATSCHPGPYQHGEQHRA